MICMIFPISEPELPVAPVLTKLQSTLYSQQGHEADSFYVYIPNVSKLPYQKIVKISSTCRQVGELKKTQVCVKPLQENSTPICKMVSRFTTSQ